MRIFWSIDRDMANRDTTEASTPMRNARVIPLRLIAPIGPVDAGILFRTGTRTLRPVDVLLLSPILIPVTVIVLLLLLAWFVLWLATVGTLVTVNLIADGSYAAFWCLRGGPWRGPDRRAIGFSGH
jgi:hypothetical protein